MEGILCVYDQVTSESDKSSGALVFLVSESPRARFRQALQHGQDAAGERLGFRRAVHPTPATHAILTVIKGGRKRDSDTFTHKNSGSCI